MNSQSIDQAVADGVAFTKRGRIGLRGSRSRTDQYRIR